MTESEDEPGDYDRDAAVSDDEIITLTNYVRRELYLSRSQDSDAPDVPHSEV